MTTAPRELEERFRARLTELGAARPGRPVVVAVSGGLDSLVLLHLLRFASPLGREDLVAAHLDHGLRPGSGDDAVWLRGLLRSWGVTGRFHALPVPPSSEAEARTERYEFLHGVASELGGAPVFLAHHADDQAETVLFRALRGTGITGLQGIPDRRAPGVLRPLLPFWKDELRTYAGRRAVRPRVDDTNVDPRFARNVLRHDVLPTVERGVAPGARAALVRLARLARENEGAWESLEPELLDRILITAPEEGGEDRFVLDRRGFLSYHPGIRARLLRRMLGELGIALDEAGTRAALAFTSSGASGGGLDLPDGLVLRRDFGRLSIGPVRERGPDAPLDLGGPGAGRGEFTVGGRTMRACWSEGGPPRGTWVERFSPSGLAFPLHFRSWNPGDRIRLPAGSRKLKKVFGEHGIPQPDRHRWPVVADAEGSVLWIPGLARSTLAPPREEEQALIIGIADVDDR